MPSKQAQKKQETGKTSRSARPNQEESKKRKVDEEDQEVLDDIDELLRMYEKFKSYGKKIETRLKQLDGGGYLTYELKDYLRQLYRRDGNMLDLLEEDKRELLEEDDSESSSDDQEQRVQKFFEDIQAPSMRSVVAKSMAAKSKTTKPMAASSGYVVSTNRS